MKKAKLAIIIVLLLFICTVIGVLIGRHSVQNNISISYEYDAINLTSAKNEIAVVPAIEDSKININIASASQLALLPGIGDVIAKRIVDYRTENGPFSTIEDLTLVAGIGDTRLESIRDLITTGG